MDGNGRWAKERGLPRTSGHEAGEKVLFDLVEAAIGFGVKEISAYAFSTENWKRTPEEVKFLMGYSRDVLRRRRDRFGRRDSVANRRRCCKTDRDRRTTTPARPPSTPPAPARWCR